MKRLFTCVVLAGMLVNSANLILADDAVKPAQTSNSGSNDAAKKADVSSIYDTVLGYVPSVLKDHPYFVAGGLAALVAVYIGYKVTKDRDCGDSCGSRMYKANI